MTRSEWVTVFAVLVAPLLAVQAQKWLEGVRERKRRKEFIFHSLMATRAATVSAEHVRALNMIDIEFYGRRILGFRYQTKREKQVVAAWRSHLDHLNLAASPENVVAWNIRRGDLFVELLHEMALAVGYDYDKVLLNRSIYSPQAHGKQEEAELVVREGMVEIMRGNKAFPISIVSAPGVQPPPPPPPAQR